MVKTTNMLMIIRGNFISEEFLPDTITKTKIYNPGNNVKGRINLGKN